MTKQTNEKGFTIIEVVLVLAIAGLIFLIVFLALPQLQRSRRDTQRKNDAGRVVASLESYAGNNNGEYPDDPGEETDFVDNYLFNNNNVLNDPQRGQYSIDWSGNQDPDVGTISVTVGENCDDTDNQTRDVAVRVGVEEGSYCQDNR